MTKQKKLRGLNGIQNEKVPFTHQQITDALYYLEEVMERTQLPYFLLEGVAKQVHDNVPYFSLDQIDAGVEEKFMQESGKGMLDIVLPNIYKDGNTISFEHNGVPIVIWIIHKHWKFFAQPDTVFYGITNFKIPNPFKKYWKCRFIIK